MVVETKLSTSVVPNGAAAGVFPYPAAVEEASDRETSPEDKPSSPHSQSQKQLDVLLDFQRMRNGLVKASDAFRLLMPNYGLTPAFLAAGDLLYTAASNRVAARHTALTAAIAATEQQARASYIGFRRIGRTAIHLASGRKSLLLDEKLPQAKESFVEVAERVLTAAQQEPYATQLAAATFDSERVTEALAALDRLTVCIDERKVAAKAAKEATEARNAAIEELRVYIQQLRANVSTLLRLNPSLHAPVGF
jgi:hypothetical protein